LFLLRSLRFQSRVVITTVIPHPTEFNRILLAETRLLRQRRLMHPPNLHLQAHNHFLSVWQ
jgi:hypothetical protein